MGLFNYYPSNPKKLDIELEKKIFIHSLIFPAAFVFVFWMVEIIKQTTGLDFVRFGIYPLRLKGLHGILFSPFIHSGINHLISNSVPFFILLFTLIYFYRRISYRIFFQMYILAGLCVWFSGREAWHIGASGLVYALAAFHFVSGIIRNDTRLLTLSVVVVFLYGGLIWGILPINPDISWEGHLGGAVSGVVMAVYYRKYIIRRDKFEWEEEEEEVDSLSEEEESSQLQEKGVGSMQTQSIKPVQIEKTKDYDSEKEREEENSDNTEIQKPNNISRTDEF